MDFNEFADRSSGPVYEILLRLARERKTITYKDLAHEAGVPDADKPYIWFSYLPGLLDEINVVEKEADRPLLSAIVVRKEDGLPGDGFFFNLTARPYLVPAGATKEEKRAVHGQELKQVYKTWSESVNDVEQEDYAEKHFESVYEVLASIACQEQTITYSNLVREANLPAGLDEMRRLYELLCDINATEMQEDWPMLSAVVVRAEDGWPGSGFYTCAQALGRLAAGASKETREDFWVKELKRVHTAWVEFAEQEEGQDDD